MLNRPRHLIGVGVLVIGLAAVALAASGSFRLGLGPWSDSAPDEREALLLAVREALRAKAVAARSFDLSVLAASFADDTRVPLTGKQQQTLQRVARGTASSGYLTFQVAFFQHWQRGAEAADRVFAAHAAGRVPDRSDVMAAIPRRTDPLYELPLKVVLAKSSGDYAYVEADSGAEYMRVTLVRRDGKWLVAGEDNTARN